MKHTPLFALLLLVGALFCLPVNGICQTAPKAPAKAAPAQNEVEQVRALGIKFVNAVVDADLEALKECCDASMLDDAQEALKEANQDPEMKEFARALLLEAMKESKFVVKGDTAWLVEDDGDKELFAKKKNGKWKMCDD